VKINGQYYREVEPLAVASDFSDYFTFQQDSAQKKTVDLLKHESPNLIPP